MAKYSKEIVGKITDLIQKDSYTITEICKAVRISTETYFQWLKKSDFSESIKKAKEAFNERIKVDAEKSLVKMINGYDVTETKTVYTKTRDKSQKLQVKEQTHTVKHIQPNPALIIFALTNRDPDKWKNKQYTDVTSGGKELQQITGMIIK
jgi:hypothetical protein